MAWTTRKQLVLILAVLVALQVLSVNGDWGGWDWERGSDWKDLRDKWRDCPRQFRMLDAPYCYRYWKYFKDLDPWFGRSIAENSREGWGYHHWGYVPIRRLRNKRD